MLTGITNNYKCFTDLRRLFATNRLKIIQIYFKEILHEKFFIVFDIGLY